jgi:hypothetical protein
MQSTLITTAETEQPSTSPTTTKKHQPRLMGQWQKIDGKLICRWILVD